MTLKLGLPALKQLQTNMLPEKRKPSVRGWACLNSPIKGLLTMQHIASPKTEIHLPLFAWANRHRAKPFPQINRYQVDGNLRVTRFEVLK
jgi:hypothetical protein